MTEHSPITPKATTELTNLELQRDEYNRLQAKLRPANKAVVFDALSRAGISLVIVDFDGYGDSGQIQNIEAKAGDEVVALPSDKVDLGWAILGMAEPKREVMSIDKAIEQLTYDFLEETHGGWENNEGAYGDFIFNVTKRIITLNFNERYIEIEYHEHIF